MTYKVENVPELNGYTVEWAEPGNFYLSRRNVIYHSPDLKHPFSRVAEIAAPFWKNAASRLRLAQRLLRFQVTNVIPFGNGEIFVTFDKSVGVIKENQFRHLDGLVRPCRVLRGACAVTPRDEVYFGEYLANNERGEMRIYKYSPGHDELENVFTFPPNSIKHIHGIYYDQFSDALFCLTGDDEKECRIMRSDDGFRTLQVVGEGDETWRAVSILFKENSMFYGMDAEFRTNHLYEVDRETYQRKSLAEVSGTVFYSARLGDDLFFTTTAENAPSQTENVATIWHVDHEGNCAEIARYQKDFWHPTLFQFGTIHFPCVNKNQNELFFHLVGVKGDNRSFRIRKAD